MGIREFCKSNSIEIENQYKDLLGVLERTNPCHQQYHMENSTFIVSYRLNLDILNLWKKVSLKVDANIIGLPISVSEPGYIGKERDVESFISRQRGLWIVLNGKRPFSVPAKTLSTFVFKNRFHSFSQYISTLRSPYRRRVRKALNKRDLLTIEEGDFTLQHYNLYREVVKRSDHPLEVLSEDFFRSYDGSIHDFRNKEGKLLAFVLTAKKEDSLGFVFCGFRRKDVEEYDLYFNMLLWIIQLGIENGVGDIDFGQTSEESKLKIGCIEQEKYLYIHHHNPLLGFVLKKLLPFFSYRSYPISHRVFKEGYNADLS